MSRPTLKGIFFDFGNTLIFEEPGKHLWEMAVTPLPHALEVLTELKSRFRLGIISNTVGSGDAELDTVLERAGMRHLIDALVTSRDFGRAKPDAAIYEEAARRLQVALAETCMVGDRLDTDIAGARNAGIPGIWLRGFNQVADPQIAPAWTIDSLSELPGCVQALYTQR